MIAKAGAGPEPIPQDELSIERLSAALTFVKSKQVKEAAERMGQQIRSEVRHLTLANDLNSIWTCRTESRMELSRFIVIYPC